ncbi:MAG: nSTAND1 domain-containing NTPase [Bacteroidales bacterium]
MSSENEKSKISPFIGLRPFGQEDSSFFFGRELESKEIIEKLIRNRFVAVIGNSGCGKTSVLNCRVIPALTGNNNSESEGWKIITMAPGINPIGNLSAAIVRSATHTGNSESLKISIADALRSNPDALNVIVNDMVIRNNEKGLILVDQFEELFRYGQKVTGTVAGNDTMTFVNILMNAVEQPGSSLYLVIVVCSDYISECTRFYRFTQSVIINRSSVLIPDMQEESLKTIIEGPLKQTGISIDPFLVEAIIGEACDKNMPLPLIQHLLMRIWSHWHKFDDKTRSLSINDYEASGGLGRALDIHGEEIYENLSEREKRVCEMIFKTITAKGTGSERFRKPSSLGLIRSVTGCSSGELNDVIAKLCSEETGFLGYSGSFPANDDSVIDVSYDCILHSWKRLMEWMDEEALSAETYLRLSEMSALYQQGGKGLLQPPELHTFINWHEKQKPSPQWAMRYHPAFERAIVYLKTSENQYMAEEEKRKKDQKKKSIWRRFFIVSLGAIALLMAGITFFAFEKKKANEKALKIAEMEKQFADSVSSVVLNEKLAADSVAISARQKEQEAIVQKETAERRQIDALINAQEALRKEEKARRKADSAEQAGKIARINEEQALFQKNEALRLRMISTGKTMSVKSLQFNGQKELQTLLAYHAYLFNTKYIGNPNDADIYTGLYNIAKQYGNAHYNVLKGHNGSVKCIAFVPGKREFFTAGTDGKIMKWNLDSKEIALQVIYSGTEIIEVLSVSTDAAWLACGTDNSLIKMIPLKGGTDIQYDLKGHSGKLKSLIFSYDSKYLYSAALDGKILKWDLAAKTSVNVETGRLQINSIDISSKGNYLAGITNDGKALVWETGTNTDVLRIEKSGEIIRVIRFRPGENIIAAGYSDGSLELWDITGQRKISEIKAHDSEINDIRFNNPLVQMATAGNDGTLKLWDLNDLKAFPVVFNDNDDIVIAIEFSSDGELIVSGSAGGESNLVSRPAGTHLLAKDICSTLTRNFTEDEWYNYVGKDIEYEKTCSEQEFSIKVKSIKQ